MKLTRIEEGVIKYLASLKIVSMIISVFGLASLLLGIYAAFFRGMSEDARSMNLTLIGYSIGIVGLGCLLTQAYKILDKLHKETGK